MKNIFLIVGLSLLSIIVNAQTYYNSGYTGTEIDAALLKARDSMITIGSINYSTNVRLGTSAGLSSIGAQGVFLGQGAGEHNDTVGAGGGYNTYVGYQAGKGVSGSNSGVSNTAVGNIALTNNTTGYHVSAFGYGSLYSHTEGHDNNAFGFLALRNLTTGSGNNAFGVDALYTNTTSDYNNAFGDATLYYCTGTRNNVFGGYAGYNLSTGNRNIFIGDRAGYNQTTNSDILIIDNRERPANSDSTGALIFGRFDADSSIQKLIINANVGVGVSPNARMEIEKNIAGDSELRITNRVDDASSFSVITFRVGSGYTEQARIRSGWSASGWHLDFDAHQSLTNGMRLLDNGKLGVGGTALSSMDSTLTVTGSGHFTTNLKVDGSKIGFSGIGSDSTAVTTGQLWFNSTTGAIHRKF